MKIVPTIFLSASLLSLVLSPMHAIAQTTGELAAGEIRKIDKEAGKVTLRHGVIKSIDMPPMTMVFVVKNPALLDTFKVGDKVNFDVMQEQGKLVVTEMQAAKP